MLLQGEHFEPLGDGFEVIVSKEHIFGTDTILLADFAAPKPFETAAELGSGCGTIPLIWCRQGLTKHITAVELQPAPVDMLKRSIKHNKLEDKIDVIEEDLRDLRGVLPADSYDVVTCNPPYQVGGSGLVNAKVSRRIARQEWTCTLEDVVAASSRLLRFGGRLCICQRPQRLADVIDIFRDNKIEAKRMRLVQQRYEKEPKLILIEGKKGGKPGGLQIMPTLLIENPTGQLSQEMRDIYGIYKSPEQGL